MRGQQRRAARAGAKGGQDGGSHGAELLGRRLGAAVPAPGVSHRHGNGRRPPPAPGGREGRKGGTAPVGLSAAGTADPAALPAGRGGAAAEGRARPCRSEARPVPGRGSAGAAVLSRGWEAAGLAVGPGGAAPALPPRERRPCGPCVFLPERRAELRPLPRAARPRPPRGSQERCGTADPPERSRLAGPQRPKLSKKHLTRFLLTLTRFFSLESLFQAYAKFSGAPLTVNTINNSWRAPKGTISAVFILSIAATL